MSAVPQPTPLLPHTWARAQRIVACRQGDVAEIVFSVRTPGWALAEAQRQTAIEARREVPDEEIDALLSNPMTCAPSPLSTRLPLASNSN